MSAAIFSFVSFQKKRSSKAEPRIDDWTAQELAELYRVRDRLVQVGLSVSIDTGISDEGEPWAVFLQDATGEVFVHIARIDGLVVVVNAVTGFKYRGRDMRSIADQMLSEVPAPVLPVSGLDGKVVMHPSAVFTAFVAAAVMIAEMARSVGAAEAAQARPPVDAKQMFPHLLERLIGRDGGWTPSALSTSAMVAGLISIASAGQLDAEKASHDLAALSIDPQTAGEASHDAPSAHHSDPSAGLGERGGEIEAVSATAPAATNSVRNDLGLTTQAEPAAGHLDPIKIVISPIAAPEEGRPLAAVKPSSDIASALPAAKDGPSQLVQPTHGPSGDAPSGDAAHAPAPNAPSTASLMASLDLPAARKLEIETSLGRYLNSLPTAHESATGEPASPPAPDTAIQPAQSYGHTLGPSMVVYLNLPSDKMVELVDGQNDIVVVGSAKLDIYGFTFGEDLLISGSEMGTAWIKSMQIDGDDVVVTGLQGQSVHLHDAYQIMS